MVRYFWNGQINGAEEGHRGTLTNHRGEKQATSYGEGGKALKATRHTTAALRYIDAAARELLVEDGTPGVALGLVADGEIIGVRTLGYADLASKLPVTPTTRFLAG